MPERIAIVGYKNGFGAREHTITWGLRKSPRVGEIFCLPGNPGTESIATNVPGYDSSVNDISDWISDNNIGLTIVGPEAPLADGLVDELASRGLRAFGPSREAAEIEWSKCNAWMFMRNYGIPTARGYIARDVDEGLKAARRLGLPVANKADGLHAGKGVDLVRTLVQAENSFNAWLQFGCVLVQEFLQGPELSVIALSDGKNIEIMPPARDYKRIGEGDQGPNTGGMGAYTNPRFATPSRISQVKREILEPAVDGLSREGRPFKGALYAGIIWTADGPRCIEFNCRFGDPEIQVILPLLDSDLLDAFDAVVDGGLKPDTMRWKRGSSLGVVRASEGYPGPYPIDREIKGLDRLSPDALVFQAGTKRVGDKVLTSGGRVLTAVSLGENLALARRGAYDLANQISFEGSYKRDDIGEDDERAYEALTGVIS